MPEGKVYLVAFWPLDHKILWMVWKGAENKLCMDRARGISYIWRMSTKSTDGKVTMKQLGGWRGLVRNPGLFLHTLRGGAHAGGDAAGNQYYQTRKPGSGKARRWVVYPGAPEASTVGPEWHAWLHYTTDAPLADTGLRPWWKPHLPNQTGTAASYRPAGHDYQKGQRARGTGDYESWSPDN
jgi:NADH:ubiquinone oxidoreductase subunit